MPPSNLTLTELTPIDPERLSKASSHDHPMREVTLAAAAGAWSAETRARVTDLFDSLAPEWSATRSSPERLVPLTDALERGVVHKGGTALELGVGSGVFTPLLGRYFDRVIAADLSFEMLAQFDGEHGSRVVADGSVLPMPDGSIDVVIAVNMLLFAGEVARILAPDGRLVWLNSRGTETPIHLPSIEVAERMAEAEPDSAWKATTSSHGSGTWAVVQRTHSLH